MFSTENRLLAFLLASRFPTPTVIYETSTGYTKLGIPPLAPPKTLRKTVA
jgi:hypothetical protein